MKNSESQYIENTDPKQKPNKNINLNNISRFKNIEMKNKENIKIISASYEKFAMRIKAHYCFNFY